MSTQYETNRAGEQVLAALMAPIESPAATFDSAAAAAANGRETASAASLSSPARGSLGGGLAARLASRRPLPTISVSDLGQAAAPPSPVIPLGPLPPIGPDAACEAEYSPESECAPPLGLAAAMAATSTPQRVGACGPDCAGAAEASGGVVTSTPCRPHLGGLSAYSSPLPPPPTASSLLAFSSPPRTDVAPWRLPDAFETGPRPPKPQSADPLPLKKKKNRAKQAERVRRELQLVEGGGEVSVEASIESTGGDGGPPEPGG